MRVEWTPAALADLDGILEHLPDDVAANTARRIVRVEGNITLFPRATLYHADLDVYERYVPKTRVILIYRIVGEIIEIISAFHTSRDPATKPTT